ncbi:MAG: YbgC/FadM family acyl-CoA thioesterase [Chitinispirillia bacterium]
MKIRIYYEDTDCGNVVYYANYLKYMERSRTEYLRERGVNLEEYHKKGLVFAIGEVYAKYRYPAKYNELIEVESEITDLSSATITFETNIYNEKDKLLFNGSAKLFCISSTSGKAIKMPKEILKFLR